VEHRIQEHLAREANRGPLERWYRGRVGEQTQRYEAWVLQQFDGVVTLSEQDANAMRAIEPTAAVSAIPPSVQVDAEAQYQPAGMHLSFLGSLDWQPNLTGVQWFLEDVLPLIAARIPEVCLHIAGRGAAESLGHDLDTSHVRFHGFVEDAVQFKATYGPTIIPLFSGSGIRVKLMEAFAHAVPVVSTTRGAEGLAVESGVHLAIADDAAAFAEACIEMLTQPERAAALAERAKSWVAGGFGPASTIQRIEEVIVHAIDRRRS